MSKLHAHAQIEYTTDEGSVESLVGFNPTSAEDRKMAHDMLDEYLDFLAKKHKDMESRGQHFWTDDGEGFQIYPTMDTH